MANKKGFGVEISLYPLLVAASGAVPVHYVMAPDGSSPPYVVYQRIATRFDPTLTNVSQFTVVMVQIDVFDTLADLAASRMYEIKNQLRGKRFPGGYEDEISGLIFENEYVGIDPFEKAHRRTLIIKVMLREASSDLGDGGELP